MKLTASWLEDFIAVPTADPHELADAFESLGHEVEDWQVLKPSFTGVLAGKVLEVAPHPHADRLRLAKIDVGGEVLDIVCRAWNFGAGAVVPVAVPGAVVGGDTTIARRDIRGITSHGMICSEAELGLGDESGGIMVLNSDYPGAVAQIGSPITAIVGLPDVFFDVNVTPNRPDCLSVYGLARDLAAFYEIPLRSHDIEVEEVGAPLRIDVTIDVPDMCPRFAGREVRGITIGDSPHWMRWRLVQAGIRPISNIVDSSNYAMVEFGQPTHVFDIHELGKTVQVRMATDAENLITLDGRKRTLSSQDIIVTDGATPVAIGGVMGGASTEVHEDTVDVFVEAAYWNPGNILMTSKRLGLRSEASIRFERGVDPSFCPLGADRVAQLLAMIAGGSPAPGPVDVNPGQIRPWVINYPLSETKRVLGIDLDRNTTGGLLERLTFGVAGEDPLAVTVPTRRSDIRQPVDLVEEIARLHGFSRIPNTIPKGPGGSLPRREKRMRRIREVLVGAGFHESLSFSFMSATDLELFDPEAAAIGNEAIRVINPLNDAEDLMRTSLIPGLLKGAAVNMARRLPSASLFEIGKVFLRGSENLPRQPDRLGFVLAGSDEPTWNSTPHKIDIYDGTGVVELLAASLRVPDLSFVPSSRPEFHPGRSADIMIDDATIGSVGEIHPRVAESLNLSGRVVAAELDLDELVLDRQPWQFQPPSAFPPIVFDMAFLASDAVSGAAVIHAAAAGAGELVESLTLFDVFSGESVGSGMVSYALRFHLRAPDRTLTDQEGGEIRRRIAASVEDATGARLRGEA